MPREKFKTLTEQMFYILLCLCEERCGIEILDSVRDLTDDRVKIGSGTLYDLLEQFTKAVSYTHLILKNQKPLLSIS